MLDFLHLSTQEEAIAPSPQPMQFTVKPSGELNFKGTPNKDLIQQLMVSSEYLASSNKQIERERNKATDRINLLTICFLGSSFIVAIACFFWSFNASTNKDLNNVNREFIRGDYCR